MSSQRVWPALLGAGVGARTSRIEAQQQAGRLGDARPFVTGEGGRERLLEATVRGCTGTKAGAPLARSSAAVRAAPRLRAMLSCQDCRL